MDGEEDSNFFEQPAVLPFPLPFSPRTWAIIIGIAAPLLLLLSHGSLIMLIGWCAAVAAMLALRSLWPATDDRAEPAAAVPDLVAETVEPVVSGGYTVIEETVLRAWQSAVLGLRFPPLVLYAIWLLLRLSLSEEPLKPREVRRCIGAWIFSVFTLVIFLWLPQFAR